MSFCFDELCSIISRLRAPNGCPWDREQTPQTLRTCLIEECFEVVNAIDRNDSVNVREELGDVLLNVVMLSEIYKEKSEFTVDDVLKEVNEKLMQFEMAYMYTFGDDRLPDNIVYDQELLHGNKQRMFDFVWIYSNISTFHLNKK